jgi:hypothetical protein
MRQIWKIVLFSELLDFFLLVIVLNFQGFWYFLPQPINEINKCQKSCNCRKRTNNDRHEAHAHETVDALSLIDIFFSFDCKNLNSAVAEDDLKGEDHDC